MSIGRNRDSGASCARSGHGDRYGVDVVPARRYESAGLHRDQTHSNLRGAVALEAAMDRYARGEDCAFIFVYAQLAPRMNAALLARGCDRTLAEDLVQQAFLQMHRARARYKTGQQVSPWATSIVRRLLVDHWRKSQREHTHNRFQYSEFEQVDPEHQLIAKQVVARLACGLERLPTTQRQAFELVRLDGFSLAEAAASLGTTVLGIKLRLRRARAALCDAVEREDA